MIQWLMSGDTLTAGRGDVARLRLLHVKHTTSWHAATLWHLAFQNHVSPSLAAFEARRLLRILTACSRVLLGKLTGSQLVKKFLALYGTRRFITAFTSARHLSLSWASSIQSIPPHPTTWRFILILSAHLRLGLPSSLFSSGGWLH